MRVEYKSDENGIGNGVSDIQFQNIFLKIARRKIQWKRNCEFM